MNEIDVVITWVDGNDTEWQKQKQQYTPPEERESSSDERYRDWDNLQYVLRGIDKFMPWVRRIHLVTWGHIPAWLKQTDGRLNVVKHEDFIPKRYLPTFNSNAIELNLHRIPGIANQFICFNDDMFVVKPTQPGDFFVDGKVRDMACISPQPIYRSSIMNIELNNMKIINDYFSHEDIKAHKRKWLCAMNGQYAVRTALFMRFNSIIGIFQPHIPYVFLKSTFEELWEKEAHVMDMTCMNKFRTIGDVNIWLLRSWQLLKGEFEPRTPKFGKLISASDIDAVKHYLSPKGKCSLVCINDDESVVDFENMRNEVNEQLNNIFPEKSPYEL